MRHTLSNMSRREMYIAGGICCLLLLIIAYFYFLQQGNGKKAKVSKGNPVVETYTVVRKDMMRHVSLFGQTVADANIAIAPKYTGRIMAVNVKLGDRVKTGDVLLVQDTVDLELSIRQNNAATRVAAADAIEAESTYNADYIKTKNAYGLQRTKYERNQYLFSIGAISQDTLDTLEQEYMASKSAFDALDNQVSGETPAVVESKRAAVDKSYYGTQALEKQREDLILTAPRDGVIGYRAAEVGAIASAGTKVFDIVDNTHIYVDCPLSENDAAVLKPGLDVQVSIDAMGAVYKGKIIYVSPSMDDSAKTYTARIVLDEADVNIKAGLFARTMIDILQRAQTLYVPKEAVQTKNGRTSVFVIHEDNTVEQRDIKLGLMNDETEEIIDGLAEGDLVATSNQDKLKDGIAVDLANAGDGE